MKLITTALGSYLTGDDIADAVQEYSHALARDQATDLVDIPVITDHTTARLRFTVGWLVQLHTLDAATDHPELIDPATTQALRARTAMRLEGDSGTARFIDPWDTDFLDQDR
ncbi:hypothetical protein [Microbacterium timonense]|jgi:hypothetical protein|uniref:hypothetical protein n=1 Tax=Microbacterium timonense TaxID=2086576 RepID=UPI000D1049C3|nr:hypothetical protein [Microbacterium timonense]